MRPQGEDSAGLPSILAASDGYLDLVADLSADYAGADDLTAVHLRALERIRSAMQVAGSSLFLLENNDSELVCRACIGAIDITGMRLPANAGITGRAVQSNSVQIVTDVSTDPDFHTLTDSQSGFVTHGVLCAPLSIRDRVLGAITVVNPQNAQRSFSPQSIELLKSLASAAAMAMHNADMTHELLARERVRQELVLAAEVQKRLLPDCSSLPESVSGLSRPAREMSGDFFDVVSLDDGRLYFAVADVSGKGLNAALLMVKTATLFRLLAKSIPEPGRLLATLNRELCDTISGGMFVTMTVGIYDPSTGRVCLSNAGHVPSLIRHARGAYRCLSAAMPPLGIVCEIQDNRYPEDDVLLCSGELYLYSDGVTEGRVGDSDMLGIDGFCALLDELSALPMKERLDALADRLNDETGNPRDDLTLLGIATAASRSPRLPLAFRVTALPDRLALLRDLLRHALAPLQISQDEKDGIVLAVDEACQNIIRHAYANTDEGEIEGHVSLDQGALRIELRDQAAVASAAVCSPPAAPDADTQELRPGGLGRQLMYDIMDEIHFAEPDPDYSQPAGNCLVMVKQLG